MKIKKKGISYEADSVACGGAIINVNGTTITDCALMARAMKLSLSSKGYTVFVDSDELWFPSFSKAYEFATTKQKGGSSL